MCGKSFDCYWGALLQREAYLGDDRHCITARRGPGRSFGRLPQALPDTSEHAVYGYHTS